jgi:hypothetical protein
MPRRGPTVRQVYAIAAALCAKLDEPWPETFDEASQLIGRIRTEIGHAQPRLEECASRRRPKWARRLDRELHDEIVDEFLVSGRKRRAIEHT